MQVFLVQRYDYDQPALGWVTISEHPDQPGVVPQGGTGPVVSRLRREVRHWDPRRGPRPEYVYRVVSRTEERVS